MMRGMFAAISGLQVHQTMLDVTANDIANVNTVGFKGRADVSFKDALSQLQCGASAPSATLGGTNAAQIGLGVQLGAIDNQMGSGAIQSTGNPLDLAIQGDGFFRVTNDPTGSARHATPARRQLHDDANGNLVTQDGNYVLGNALDSTGAPTSTRRPINIPAGATSVSIGQDGVVSYVDSTGTSTTLAHHARQVPERRGPAARQRQQVQRVEQLGRRDRPRPAGTNGLGTLTPGALEMSNVDLAQEFTNMIKAQRGFQANSRVITTADEMLQELVNLA